MALVPEIDRLLSMDEENVTEMRRFLSASAGDCLEVMNQAAVNYTTATRAFAQGVENPWKDLLDVMSDLSVEDIPSLLALLNEQEATTARSDILSRASQMLDEHFSRENRGMLLSRLGVLYATAIADFMRMRATAPLGSIRIQCESAALMKLMRGSPSISREWRLIETDQDGRRFFRDHQSAVKDALREFGLAFAYENASSTALHSRFAGIALGLRSSAATDGPRVTQKIEVAAQELNPTNPDLFLLLVFHCLRVQDRIFQQLPRICPEIQDRLLVETRIPNFSRSVDDLFGDFQSRKPDLLERYRRSEHEGSTATA